MYAAGESAKKKTQKKAFPKLIVVKSIRSPKLIASPKLFKNLNYRKTVCIFECRTYNYIKWPPRICSRRFVLPIFDLIPRKYFYVEDLLGRMPRISVCLRETSSRCTIHTPFSTLSVPNPSLMPCSWCPVTLALSLGTWSIPHALQLMPGDSEQIQYDKLTVNGDAKR